MSSFITAYRVSLERLRHASGSRDDMLLSYVVRQSAEFLNQVDDATGSELSCADAVADIINGGVLDEEFGSVYGYAYEAICNAIGQFRSSIGPIAGRSSKFMASIDAALGEMAVPLTFEELCYNGPLITIPEADDGFPSIGYWSSDQLARARPIVASLDATKVDQEHIDTFTKISEWLSEPSRTGDTHLVGILS